MFAKYIVLVLYSVAMGTGFDLHSKPNKQSGSGVVILWHVSLSEQRPTKGTLIHINYYGLLTTILGSGFCGFGGDYSHVILS